MTRNSLAGSAARDALAKVLLVSAACCGFLVESADCQTLPARPVSGIETADSLVSAEFAKDSVGSITVGVIAGSQLAWTRSVGFADMKTRRLANRNTVYRIGSITKPFTAVMLMQLVAAGRVQLSDPVERYLPEVKQIASRPQGAPPFTFLQLATMTAGLSREPEEAGPFWTGPVSDWEKKLFAALSQPRRERRGISRRDVLRPRTAAGCGGLQQCRRRRGNPDRLAADILSMLASKKRAEIQADIGRRVKEQVASPGGEAAVRRLIEELRIGKPDYELMSSAQAREARRQITQHQATIAKLGALQSLLGLRLLRRRSYLIRSQVSSIVGPSTHQK